eukprot:TRINITY_DN5155_c0_g1_i5.p1 TRINITY_DN5155_c0_g1~~TRINITY_DN5155_c0_g1_i5.p1  ORF type:complete len:171 (+),score=12.51 TRINITY_DN5155_c0_g1_i5:31-543(+)
MYTGLLQPFRKSLALTSYFMLPEQGMTKWDVLSRGSVFFVKSNAKRKKLHVVSAAHITHPFSFPRLYPPAQYPWLQFVREDAVHNFIQLREIGTGKVTDEFELDSTTHQKLGADLIVMHLKEEDEFISKMEKYNTPLETVQLEHHEILREQLKNKVSRNSFNNLTSHEHS